MGKGPGKSTSRNVLPHPYSDFIYAIIIEEYGLVGGAAVLMLYLVILYRGMITLSNSERAFGALLSAGLSFSLVIQSMINMGVAVGLGPITGLPLPLLSMGGSSIIFTSFASGVILSVSNSIDNNENIYVLDDGEVLFGSESEDPPTNYSYYDRIWWVSLKDNQDRIYATAIAREKQQAEQKCAFNALVKLGREKDQQDLDFEDTELDEWVNIYNSKNEYLGVPVISKIESVI